MLHQRQPPWENVAAVGVVAVVVFAVGFLVFARLERSFAKIA
jgi:ABC-type polysaccharide/polyol phosphate export permease